MKRRLFILGLFAISAVFSISDGAKLDNREALKVFSNPLPQDATFTSVGFECTIFSFAFPEMYLYMKHHYFITDYLRLKKGRPKNAEAINWDKRGIWTIQKYGMANSTSNATQYRIRDTENKQFITFMPSEQGFFPMGGKDAVQGTLWTLELKQGFYGSVTTIETVKPPNSQLQNWYLTAVSENGQNSTRAVHLDYKLNGDLSKWTVRCGRNVVPD